MSKRDMLYDAWRKNPDLDISTFAKKIQLDNSTAYRYVRDFKLSSNSSKTKSNESKSQIRTISLNDLIDNERLDIKKIIHTGIKSIPSGVVAYDDNLRRDLQIPEPKWREYSREEEFDDFKALLPNRKTVWGSKTTIEKVKEMDGVT